MGLFPQVSSIFNPVEEHKLLSGVVDAPVNYRNKRSVHHSCRRGAVSFVESRMENFSPEFKT